jgi:aminopeptidase N
MDRYRFKSAEAQELRLAFEEVTGEDLNWFWNEWYYNNGYPELDIRYEYDESAGKVKVILSQEQGSHLFKLPVTIDVYAGGAKQRYKVWSEEKTDTFLFSCPVRPDLVNVDADKVLLARKQDHKTIDNYIFQYSHAPLYMDRREAIEGCAKAQTTNDAAGKTLLAALKDKYYGLRIVAMQHLNLKDGNIRQAALPLLLNIAQHDPKAPARVVAIAILGKLKDAGHLPLFNRALSDSSYGVEAAALAGIAAQQPQEAYEKAKQLQQGARADLIQAICQVYATQGNRQDMQYIIYNLQHQSLNMKLAFLDPLLTAMEKATLPADTAKSYLDMIKTSAEAYNNKMAVQYVAGMLQDFAATCGNKAASAEGEAKSSLQFQADYARSLAGALAGNAGNPQ